MMIAGSKVGLKEYNEFCKGLKAGSILYNINTSNNWGEYLHVVNVDRIQYNNLTIYTVLLLGIKKEEGKYISRDFIVSLTPDLGDHISFLKYVGYSKFTLVPVLEDIKINVGLVARFSQIDLHEYAQNLSIRKPVNRKYGKNGKLIIRKTGN